MPAVGLRRGYLMANTQQARLAGLAAFLPSVATIDLRSLGKIYEQNRHRVYGLSFWMLGNEPAAEELMRNVFLRVFATSANPSAEAVDRALITELREIAPLGPLTLEVADAAEVIGVRRNTLRTHLESAVV